MKIPGIDVGGSGIKGALVDTGSGDFVGERLRMPTPASATPGAVIGAIVKLCDTLSRKGRFGCGFPGVVQHGIVKTAVNLHPDWRDFDLGTALRAATLSKETRSK